MLKSAKRREEMRHKVLWSLVRLIALTYLAAFVGLDAVGDASALKVDACWICVQNKKNFGCQTRTRGWQGCATTAHSCTLVGPGCGN